MLNPYIYIYVYIYTHIIYIYTHTFPKLEIECVDSNPQLEVCWVYIRVRATFHNVYFFVT